MAFLLAVVNPRRGVGSRKDTAGLICAGHAEPAPARVSAMPSEKCHWCRGT
jgi:hypothetical protein